MARKNKITVFCGSADGASPLYAEEAARLGRLLAEQERTLVYGGGNRGLMGVVAKAARELGGHAVGVNLKRFNNPRYLMDVDENYVTETLQERKARLIELGDASIALPGGIGTLDELSEVYSMLQLGLTNRPLGLLNVGGYYDLLLRFAEQMRGEGFLKPKYNRMFIVENTPEALLAALDAFDETEEFK